MNYILYPGLQYNCLVSARLLPAGILLSFPRHCQVDLPKHISTNILHDYPEHSQLRLLALALHPKHVRLCIRIEALTCRRHTEQHCMIFDHRKLICRVYKSTATQIPANCIHIS